MSTCSASRSAGTKVTARHLRSKGFTDEELTIGGLCGRGSRGLYDRFRGRLVWPIRDITGDTIGFGARRLYDNDRIAAKYLNTTETPIYKKSSVLYGLDLAKKPIRDERQVVVGEVRPPAARPPSSRWWRSTLIPLQRDRPCRARNAAEASQ